MFKTVKTILDAVFTPETSYPQSRIDDLTTPLIENGESMIIAKNECKEQVIIAVPDNPEKNSYKAKHKELHNLLLKCERLISYFKSNTFYIFMNTESKIKLYALNQLLDDIKYDLEYGDVAFLDELNDRYLRLKSEINVSSMSLAEMNST